MKGFGTNETIEQEQVIKGSNFIRVNGKIRVPEVRVIDDEGKQVGVMNTRDALTLAQQRGVDLVEVSPNAKPPVCRLVDFGKFKYEEEKKLREARKHQAASKVKELKFHINIAAHDYQTKINHAVEFLEDGDKVKILVELRRRESGHADIARGIMQQIKADLEPFGQIEAEPKSIGRNIIMMINPLPASKRAALKKTDHAETKDAPMIDPSKIVVEKVAIRRADNAPRDKEFKHNPFEQIKK